MDLLTEIGIDPRLFLAVTAAATVLTVVLYYRFVINIFDNLIFFIVGSVACDALVFGMPWSPALKIEYAFFALSFWAGFAVRGRIPKVHSHIYRSRRLLLQLECVLLMLFALLVAGNLLVGLTSGFPLLSDRPDAAKVTMYQGGFGVVRRLNMMPFSFFVSGCIILMIVNYKRSRFAAMLGIASLLLMVTGSKGALLPLVLIAGLALAHQGLIAGNLKLARSISRYATLSYIAAASLAVLILVIDSKQGLIGGLQLLMKRILFDGDVILYYFPSRGNNPALVGLNGFDYLDYLFKGWLATVRILKEYPPALGSVIMGTDQVGFGPNPQYFVRADIFFGPFAGSIYCAAIGYGAAWLRRLFFAPERMSIASAAVRLTFAAAAFTLATDSAELIGAALDLVLLVGPLWIIAKLLVRSQEEIQNRRRKAAIAAPWDPGTNTRIP